MNEKKLIFEPNCIATGVGSLPFMDAEEACLKILKLYPVAPYWPQLPKISFLEKMSAQFSEHIPNEIVDYKNEKIWINTEMDYIENLDEFYIKYTSNKIDSFAVSSERAKGFYKFIELLSEKYHDNKKFLSNIKNSKSNIKYIKGQVTGPITLGFGILDQDRKPIFYNNIIQDTVVKSISMIAKWQENEFKKVSPNCQSIIFFDEPYLASLGSSYISLSKEQIINQLNQCFNAISGIKGIHCCGKTDWSLITETDVDIINFDAHNYFENFAIYSDDIIDFLNKGKIIAWGIVPTEPKEDDLDNLVKEIIDKFNSQIDFFVNKGLNKNFILRRSMLTHSCGLGTVSEEKANKALILLNKVSSIIGNKFFNN